MKLKIEYNKKEDWEKYGEIFVVLDRGEGDKIIHFAKAVDCLYQRNMIYHNTGIKTNFKGIYTTYEEAKNNHPGAQSMVLENNDTTKEQTKPEKAQKEQIRRYNECYVSNTGKIYTFRSEKNDLFESNYNISKAGKRTVSIINEKGQRTTSNVDSIVYKAFIDENIGKKSIMHKDGNPLNDNIENLEIAEERRIDYKEKCKMLEELLKKNGISIDE